jgi:hypothetical protein
MSIQNQKLIVFEQYQKTVQSEIRQLQQVVEENLPEEAFNSASETMSMIFSKLAEGDRLSNTTKSLKQHFNENINMKHLNMMN